MKKYTQQFLGIAGLTGTLLFLPDLNSVDAAVLQQESSGTEVTEIQQQLNNMGYLHTEATGYYGPLTDQAVKEFQRDFNLSQDGVAGAQTLQSLEDADILARTVHGEARGESFEGQVAVAAVIKNRMESSEFPSTINDVVYQQRAFTAVDDGQYNLEPDATSYQAVTEAWQGSDPSQGSLYYYNPAEATSEWIFTRPVKLDIGKHVFAD
ncbi:cell wall hydrolase [Alteribacillus sp. HJP-4]|uniref:cell wall hydrolase n=1 Tax=Alteribacillus sp. HJP-4 TaxID=2775394 RepID=UPI0035CD1D96